MYAIVKYSGSMLVFPKGPSDEIHAVVDVANVLGGMRETAPAVERTRSSARDVRLDVGALHQLVHAGRPVGSAIWAGTYRPSTAAIWSYAERLSPAVKLLTHEPGASGREVGVDAQLQVHLLRLIDKDPAILVLVTGDGAGWAHGEGFFADAERLVRRGWQIELLSWPRCTNRHLQRFAEAHGLFVSLEDHWSELTYMPHQRHSQRVRLSRRPTVSSSALLMAS